MMLTGEFFQAVFILIIPFAVRNLVDALATWTPESAQTVWEATRSLFIALVLASLLLIAAARIAGYFLYRLAPVFRLIPWEETFFGQAHRHGQRQDRRRRHA